MEALSIKSCMSAFTSIPMDTGKLCNWQNYMQNTDFTSWIVFFLDIPISFATFFSICVNTCQGASAAD